MNFLSLHNYLVEKFIPENNKVDDLAVRTKYGYLGGWVSIILNLVLFIIKIACGLWINSIALLADAFHTLSDVLTSIAIIIGFKIARKPGDKEHPFGHGRVEYVTTLLICLLLFVVGYEFLKESLRKIVHPEPVAYNSIVFVVMLLSALVKEWLYDFAKYLGIKINSQSLIADAWHHRSDAIASLLIGIALFGTYLGFNRIDAILGVVVAGLIIYTGYDLVKDCISDIIGRAPSPELVEKVKNSALSINGVKNVHDIQIHQYGIKRYVNLHIAVESRLTVHESHNIALGVETKLNKKHGLMSVVHVDPYQD